jgi:hypothetical protein
MGKTIFTNKSTQTHPMTEFVNISLMIPAARELLHELEMVGTRNPKSIISRIFFL